MRVLIIGASGYLGGELRRRARAAGHEVVGTAWSSRRDDLSRLDVRDRAAVDRFVGAVAPEVVVNAAYVQSDWATTAVGPVNVATVCAARAVRFVHVSSDAVFIGGDREVYDETCAPAPSTPYGAAKAAAEVGVAAAHASALIVRTSWILGDGRSPFESFVRALAGGAAGALFDDDVRSPVHVGDLAAALVASCASGAAGVLHVAGPESLSRYELGRLVAERDGLDPGTLPKAAKASVTGSAGAIVRLDSAKAAGVLAVRLRGAREFLRKR
ncbi:sugar nucleotide-binding protein [Glycomyces sp. NRRL B-16210]|uniref:SDR family oxidoreductase n=1 Tax=Glycomyces sp. NRRL B-16210 TaxID=1463821 RepID=UPI0004BE9F2F|nr:sugar nucleotide-binding protein [Glycomyces sp. NRRL B-16210]